MTTETEGGARGRGPGRTEEAQRLHADGARSRLAGRRPPGPGTELEPRLRRSDAECGAGLRDRWELGVRRRDLKPGRDDTLEERRARAGRIKTERETDKGRGEGPSREGDAGKPGGRGEPGGSGSGALGTRASSECRHLRSAQKTVAGRRGCWRGCAAGVGVRLHVIKMGDFYEPEERTRLRGRGHGGEKV